MTLRKNTRILTSSRKRLIGLGLVALLLVCVVAFTTLKNHRQQISAASSTANVNENTATRGKKGNSNTNVTIMSPKAGESSSGVISSKSGYQLNYPADWTTTDTSSPSSDQIELRSPEDDTAKAVFILRISVAPIADSTYQPGAIVKGEITSLSSGREIWVTHKDGALLDGETYCPVLQLVSKSDNGYHFSEKIGDGRYLTIQGGYCINERGTSPLSYEQQLASPDWKKAIDTINSLDISSVH